MASIYVSLFSNNKYLKDMSDKKLEKYKQVIRERMKIYAYANLISTMFVIVLILNDKSSDNKLRNVWMYTSIFFLSEYFIYTLWPKKNWVLQSVNNKEDVMDWLNKYRYMKRNWHIGLLLGILSVSVFTYNYFDTDNSPVTSLEIKE